MQSPVKSIKELLFNNWFTVGVLDRDIIDWVYGKPVDPAARFARNLMVFEFYELTTPREKRSLSRSRARKVVVVDFWINISSSFDVDREDLFALKQDAIDKVDVIIAANERSVTDVKFAFIAAERSLDREEDRVLRTQYEIICVYER